MIKIHHPRLARALLAGLILPLLLVSVAKADGNIDSTYKWAWGTNAGWVNFSPTGGGVAVYSDHLSGYAWGENIGWVRLGTCVSSVCTHANTGPANYGVNNDGAGNLSGFAWSAGAGWINFDPAGSAQVKIDPLTGDFSGYAWGENVGWIRFQNAALNYKVRTSWRPGVPLAYAGPDQTVEAGSLVMLDGSVSTSPSGYLPLTYAWTQTGGPPVALSDSTSPGPTFSAPGGPAMLVFSLVVTDSLGQASAPDAVVITVIGPATRFTYLPIVPVGYSAPPACKEAVANGGFEDSTAWLIAPAARPARYETDVKHAGNRSILLGLKPDEADLTGYSSIRQTITVPVSASSTVLSFWYHPLSGLDSGDRQECLLLNMNDEAIRVLMRGNANTAAWAQLALDVTAYAGQTVKLYCNALNDGEGAGTTGFYLDDVSVTNCPDSEAPQPPSTPPGCQPVTLAAIPVGDAPHGIATNAAANRIYVANHESDTLSIVNSQTNAVVATRNVGDGPNGVAYNPANGKVYVANRNSSSVTVLRASDDAVLGSIGVGALPDGVAANAATNRIYVANFGSNSVSIISGASDAVVQTIRLGASAKPSMVAVNPVTNKAYVSLHGSGRVAVIDGAGDYQAVDIHSAGPYGIAVDTVRNLIYVATITSYRLAVIDGATDTFLGYAEVWREGPDPKPVPLRMVAVNPMIGTSGHVYVTTSETDDGWDRLLLLPQGWPEQFGRARALPVAVPQEGIAFDPAKLRVYVSSRAGDRLDVFLDGEPMCADDPDAGDFRLNLCAGSSCGAAASAGD